MNRCVSILVFATLLACSASAQQGTVRGGAEPSARSVTALEHMLNRMPRLGSTARANATANPRFVRSDLLRIEVPDSSQPIRGTLVRLFADKGETIAEHGESLVDLLAVAPFEDFQVTPIFSENEYPNGPNQYHVTFGSVTMAPNQEFFGLVGTLHTEPIAEADFRNIYFVDFEVEIDGLMVRGDEFRYGEPFVTEQNGVPGIVSYLDYSHRIKTRGVHHVLYRWTTRTSLGDCNVDCLNAGTWVFEFTIEVQ
jgi:hypothetical protein